MTANQIKAAEHFERKRSNLRNEAIAQGNLDESVRHNIAVESETVRHNTVGEGLTARDLSERARSNKANEAIRIESNRLAADRNAIAEAKRQQDQVFGAVNATAKIIDAIIPF